MKTAAHLKQCLAYCSLFPKEHKFENHKLIQMWIAQGFVQPQGRRPIEDIGGDCFDSLLCRSFFQQVEESYFMHDMIHDLAQFVSLDECFKVVDGKLHRVPEWALHLSLVSDNLDPTAFNNMQKFRRLRTLLFLHDCKSGFDHIPEDLFIKLKYLRVLDLSYNDIKVLPNSIGNLKHLRYLDVSYTSIAELPETTGNLYNLQTLKLEGCSVLSLPKSITKLINLRNLKANAKSISTIAGIGRLTRLEELVEFKVHKEGGHKIAELKDMTELQKIHILQLENVINKEEAQKARLKDKKHLHILTLEWTHNRESNSTDELDGEVLEGLQPPHKNLRELNIWCNAGTKSPSWMRNHFLSNLEILRLQNCKNWEVLPPLGQLRFLRYLKISGMDRVKKVDRYFYGTEETGFPSLVELSFDEMPEWEEWSSAEGGQPFPTLQELLILSCPMLQRMPPLHPTLARLWIRRVGLVALPDLWGCQGIKLNSNAPSSLSSLEITECPNLTSLREGFLRHYLRSFEQLIIASCPELVHSPEEEGIPALLSLKSLTMENCPKLAALLEENLPLLAHLKISGHLELRMSLQILTSLYSLSISDCLNISSLPEEMLCNLTTLEELAVSGCSELAMLQFQALVSLKYLTVENCPMLNSSSLLPSSSLEFLEINNTPLAGLLHNLTSLLALRIYSCPQMTSFAKEEEEEFQKLTSLQTLHINDCANLQFLPAALDKLTSLECLYLNDCPQIQSLPENGLPTSLNILDIRSCPMLEDQCRKDIGPDWPKIARIPDLHMLTSSESHVANKTEEMLELLASISSDDAVA